MPNQVEIPGAREPILTALFLSVIGVATDNLINFLKTASQIDLQHFIEYIEQQNLTRENLEQVNPLFFDNEAYAETFGPNFKLIMVTSMCCGLLDLLLREYTDNRYNLLTPLSYAKNKIFS